MADLKQRSPAELANAEMPQDLSAASHLIQRHDTPIRLATALLYAAGIFLIILIIWAALTRVPQIAVAPGQIIPKGNVKLIQPIGDGVVEQIYVKEGDHVDAGQKLVLLDRIPYAEEVDKARQDLQIARSELSEHQKVQGALSAIVKDPSTLPDVAVDINNVSQIITDVYKSRATWLEAEKDVSTARDARDASDGRAAGKSDDQLMPSSSDMSMLAERLRNVILEKEAASRTLARRKEEFAAKKKALSIESASLSKQLASLKQQKQNHATILNDSKMQAQAYKEALDAGGASMQQYLEQMKTVETQELALMSHENEIAKIDHQLAVARSAELEFESKSRADVSQLEAELQKLSGQASELTMQARERRRNMSLTEHTYFSALEKAKAMLSQEADEIEHQQARIEQITSQLKAAQDKYDRAEICAPIAGTVTAIKLRGKGEVVSQKELLMTVVPATSELVVEAQLPNKDIGFVKPGQDVKLKLASFPFQDYGILKGTLIEVESVPREMDKLGGYYRVIVEPERTYMMVHGKRIPFSAGMSVSAEIITRYRTILSIVLEPLKNFQETRWN